MPEKKTTELLSELDAAVADVSDKGEALATAKAELDAAQKAYDSAYAHAEACKTRVSERIGAMLPGRVRVS